MKKTFLFIVAFVSIAFVTQSQTYQFAKESGTYQELTGASKLFFDSGSNGYYFSAAMKFPVLTGTGDFDLNASVPSNGAFVVNGGYMAVYNFPSYTHTIVFQVFYNQNMQLRDNSSGVFVKTEGSAGSRILKVQWKNIGIKNFPADYLNFQAWFHEADKSITYHFGASSLTQQIGGFSGIFMADNSFTSIVANYSLSGSSAAPAHMVTAHNFAELPYLNDLPPNGTIYHFTPAVTGTDQATATDVNIWPVPALSVLHVSLNDIAGASELYLCDMSGKVLQTVHVQRGEEATIQMENLAAGVYLLQVRSGEQVINKKIIHQ